MIVVGHQVDQVQILAHPRNVVGRIDEPFAGGNGRSEQVAARLESGAQLAQQTHKVLLVVGGASTRTWILPVKVQTVEVELGQKLHHRVDETGARLRLAGHLAVLDAALVPACELRFG